jgi:hypothetical protein
LNPGNSPAPLGNQRIAPIDQVKTALESRRFDENPVVLGNQSDLLEQLNQAYRARASWCGTDGLGSGNEQSTQQLLAIMKAHRILKNKIIKLIYSNYLYCLFIAISRMESNIE